MKKIAIIDFEGGNLFSVIQACKAINLDVSITSDYDKILNSDGLILPGVGSYPHAMKILNEKGLVKPIKDFIDCDKPFMGICLGFQLLFSKSEEFENCKGLNIIKGSVKKFNFKDNKIKVPQIGWNKIYNDKNWNNSSLKEIKQGEYMYFVHSYYVESNPVNTLFYSKFSDAQFTSSIIHENILGFQFHPEKSGQIGQKLYQEICLYN